MAFTPFPSPNISLPNETWTAVFESLESPDLVSVTCVSRRLSTIAERILYSKIQVCETISSGQFPCKTDACCKAIVRRLHLVEYMKHLHVRWTIRSSNVAWHVQSVLFNLQNALRTLAFLESLGLSLDLSTHISGEIDILRQCRLPSLCHLSLSGVGCTDVGWFLNRTPSIQHLKLLDYCFSVVLFPGALPSLSSFCGPPRIAASVVPGRPVQYLALSGRTSQQQGWLEAVRDVMPTMMRSTAPIRYLDLSNSSVTLMLLHDISKFFLDLEVLKVRFALRHALHFSSSGIRILEGLTHILGSFHNLSTLDMSSTSMNALAHDNATNELSLCVSWSGVCFSLKKVIFPSKNEWLIEKCMWVLSKGA